MRSYLTFCCCDQYHHCLLHRWGQGGVKRPAARSLVLGLKSQCLVADSNFRAGILDHHILGCHRCYLCESSEKQADPGIVISPYRWGNWGSEMITCPGRGAELTFQNKTASHSLLVHSPAWNPHWDKNGTLVLVSRTLCPGRSWTGAWEEERTDKVC